MQKLSVTSVTELSAQADVPSVELEADDDLDIYASCGTCEEIEDPILTLDALETFEIEHEASCGPDAPVWVHGLDRLYEEAGIQFEERVLDA